MSNKHSIQDDVLTVAISNSGLFRRASRFYSLVGLLGLATYCSAGVAASGPVVEIITEIRDVSPLSFQVGMKSHQTIKFDVDKKVVTNDVETGKTNIAGLDLGSIRDNFIITNQNIEKGSGRVTVSGQTASAVGVMPDIDYKFTIRFVGKKSLLWIDGCHNEYPSYTIKVNGKQIYDREQTGTAVTGLMGSCDVQVLVDGVSY